MLMTSLENWLIIQHGPFHAAPLQCFFGRDTVMMAAGLQNHPRVPDGSLSSILFSVRQDENPVSSCGGCNPSAVDELTSGHITSLQRFHKRNAEFVEDRQTLVPRTHSTQAVYCSYTSPALIKVHLFIKSTLFFYFFFFLSLAKS